MNPLVHCELALETSVHVYNKKWALISNKHEIFLFQLFICCKKAISFSYLAQITSTFRTYPGLSQNRGERATTRENQKLLSPSRPSIVHIHSWTLPLQARWVELGNSIHCSFSIRIPLYSQHARTNRLFACEKFMWSIDVEHCAFISYNLLVTVHIT